MGALAHGLRVLSRGERAPENDETECRDDPHAGEEADHPSAPHDARGPEITHDPYPDEIGNHPPPLTPPERTQRPARRDIPSQVYDDVGEHRAEHPHGDRVTRPVDDPI